MKRVVSSAASGVNGRRVAGICGASVAVSGHTPISIAAAAANDDLIKHTMLEVLREIQIHEAPAQIGLRHIDAHVITDLCERDSGVQHIGGTEREFHTAQKAFHTLQMIASPAQLDVNI